MESIICSSCNVPNSHDAVYCVNCGNSVQYFPPVYLPSPSERMAKAKNRIAIASFVLSLIPLVPLLIFMLYLAVESTWAISFGWILLLMVFLGFSIYLGTYIISIPALILGIVGCISDQKKFAIIGIFISVFNFFIPFLVSPINELFLK